MSDLTVTTKDLFSIPAFRPRNGYCRPNSKRWAKMHGLDWSKFVKEGIDADVLTATGDPFALALVDWARKRQEAVDGGQQ